MVLRTRAARERRPGDPLTATTRDRTDRSGAGLEDAASLGSPTRPTSRCQSPVHDGNLGIDAVPVVIDSGGNHAAADGNPLQCVNVGRADLAAGARS